MNKPSIPWKFAQTLCRISTTLLFDLKVFGEKNVPPTGGVLLVSNHQSFLDPVLVGVRLERPLSYLARSGLFDNFLLAIVIRWLNAYPVRQGAADVGAVKETIARLQEGHALNIFPEGSRTEDGNLLPLEKGVGLVVRRAKVPVVPVIIDGSFHAWPKGRKIFRTGKIRLLYGKPMDLSSMKGEQIVATIDKTFHEMFARLKEIERGLEINRLPSDPT